MEISRDAIVDALTQRLEFVEFIRAAWLGGSAAFDRLDEFSDIDVQFDVAAGMVQRGSRPLRRSCPRSAQLNTSGLFPCPHDTAMRSVFYRLEGTNEFAFIDIVVMNHDKEPRFNEVERQGHPIVLFDKDGVVTTTAVDDEKHAREIGGRLAAIRDGQPLGNSLVAKEIARGNPLDAFALYQRFCIEPIVELLRMKHCPERCDFGLRYVALDLPEPVFRQLVDLCFVRDLEDLATKFEEASELITVLIRELTDA
jgi:hypothetical protein